MNIQSWQSLAGHTPLAAIRCALDGREQTIYAKLEYFNPSGSIKDRIAWYMLAQARQRGELRPGQPIVEMTSGNTGIALAAAGAYSGHEVHIFMPDWASAERRSLMQMYGAVLHPVSREEGGFAGALRLSKAAARELDAYAPSQFENHDNPRAHYLTTGTEILAALPGVTDFVAGVGSGGTLMGVARRLKEDHSVRAAAVEPDSAAVLSGRPVRGEHRIEGIGDGFLPPVVQPSLIDGVHAVNDLDAVVMAARLARELGLGVGISSGANLLGALRQNREPGRQVVTVFADDNKKYLSTLLAEPPAPQTDWLSARVELRDFRIV